MMIERANEIIRFILTPPVQESEEKVQASGLSGETTDYQTTANLMLARCRLTMHYLDYWISTMGSVLNHWV